ncbi:DUF6624 domain-containing protein [Streptomyces sp. NPDC058257]|uniref:DUF6624 domain-containing protein n=1 Tax=unclassified Streptomyces TaxID=2593676 RepID=UPI003663D23B
MTKEPQRPDIARDLLDRAGKAREYRSKLARAELSQSEAAMGRHADHANAQILRRVMADHGWPGTSLVGEEAAEGAWQIVLHADHVPDFQRLALRAMTTAVEHGEATIQQWAHLHDRTNINSGHPQIYGTQYRYGPAGVEPLPIHEPENVDARRASVGLPPMSAAFAEVRRRHHTREPESGQAYDEDATPELAGAA